LARKAAKFRKLRRNDNELPHMRQGAAAWVPSSVPRLLRAENGMDRARPGRERGQPATAFAQVRQGASAGGTVALGGSAFFTIWLSQSG